MKKANGMFRLHNKLRSHKSGDKHDFVFSNFQALQVPKGWDKLFVSIVSVETGKTINKTAKASVRNGNCRWTNTLSESICVSQNDASNELEEGHIKFVVAMGSSRSSILGEAPINLANYIDSKSSLPVSIPLKKTITGAVLQVKVQCSTPTAKLRDGQQTSMNSQLEDENVEYDDTESKSDVSDGTFCKSVCSSSGNHLDNPSGELRSRDPSFSASGSLHSVDSVEASCSKDNCSPRSSLSGTVNNLSGRQDSTGSQSSSYYGSYSFNESSKSNHSSMNSKVSGTAHIQNQREDDVNEVSQTDKSLSIRNAGTSEELEAAEVTIAELKVETKMWEKNARKLMTDSEKLQKELLDQSRGQATLEMELTSSQIECEALKQEIKELKILLEESLAKLDSTGKLEFHAKDLNSFRQEYEEEMKFQKEENLSLALQLQKTQDANIELVSVLQELEETIECQRIEIDKLLEMKHEFEGGKCSHACKEGKLCDSGLEDSIVKHQKGDVELEFKERAQAVQLQQLEDLQKNMESHIHYLENTLQEKSQEIEVERGLRSQALLDCEVEWTSRLIEKEEKIFSLEGKLSAAYDARGLEKDGPKNHGSEHVTESLKQKVQELERDCTELTNENLELLLNLKESKNCSLNVSATCDFVSQDYLKGSYPLMSESETSELKSEILRLKEELNKKTTGEGLLSEHVEVADLESLLKTSEKKATRLDGQTCKCHEIIEQQKIEVIALQQQLKLYQEKEIETRNHVAAAVADVEVSESLAAVEMSELLSELEEQIQLTLVNARNKFYSFNLVTGTALAFSDSLENSKSTDVVTQTKRAKVILQTFKQLRELLEAETCISEELKCGKEACPTVVNIVDNFDGITLHASNLDIKIESDDSDLGKELPAEYDELKLDSLKMAEKDELETKQLLLDEAGESLMHSEGDLESGMYIVMQENSQVKENMESLFKEGANSSYSLDDWTIEIARMKSSKHEMEVHVSELEDESVHLSERVWSLEAQVRYLTDERESTRFELQKSELLARNFQDDVIRLEAEREKLKFDMKTRLFDMQSMWVEAQKEHEYLKVVNPNLQEIAESLIEECSLLQKSNRELRKEKIRLHEHCTVLEAEQKESENIVSSTLKMIEVLEENYSSMLEEIASKEKAINLEIDILANENRNLKEKLVTEVSVLNQLYLEKTTEAENLKREVAYFTNQISATHDEKERLASGAVLEVSHLRAGKVNLEATIQEIQRKLELAESSFSVLQMESETRVQGLVHKLAASEHNQEVLRADHEKILKLLEEVKYNEDKLKSAVRGHELKIKASEYEKLQLEEEISSLKVQLQKSTLLQDEILSVKKSLNETRLDNQRLGASVHILTKDYEELQTERNLFIQKISSGQKAISELEDCRNKKAVLEEKVLRLEGDLISTVVLGTQEASLTNELALVRRENSQCKKKIKVLEEEKEAYLKRAHVLEENLKEKDLPQDLPESTYPGLSLCPDGDGARSTTTDKFELPPMVDKKQSFSTESSQITVVDPLLKIQLLQNELAEALEANDMYKAQLKSLLSPEHSTAKESPVSNISSKRKEYESLSLLEELRDLHERYSHLSLKYAEVESEREQLALKLKTANNRRKWFS